MPPRKKTTAAPARLEETLAQQIAAQLGTDLSSKIDAAAFIESLAQHLVPKVEPTFADRVTEAIFTDRVQARGIAAAEAAMKRLPLTVGQSCGEKIAEELLEKVDVDRWSNTLNKSLNNFDHDDLAQRLADGAGFEIAEDGVQEKIADIVGENCSYNGQAADIAAMVTEGIVDRLAPGLAAYLEEAVAAGLIESLADRMLPTLQARIDSAVARKLHETIRVDMEDVTVRLVLLA